MTPTCVPRLTAFKHHTEMTLSNFDGWMKSISGAVRCSSDTLSSLLLFFVLFCCFVLFVCLLWYTNKEQERVCFCVFPEGQEWRAGSLPSGERRHVYQGKCYPASKVNLAYFGSCRRHQGEVTVRVAPDAGCRLQGY